MGQRLVISKGKADSEWKKSCQGLCDKLLEEGKSTLVLSVGNTELGMWGVHAMDLCGIDDPRLTYFLAETFVKASKDEPILKEILDYILDIISEDSSEKEKE